MKKLKIVLLLIISICLITGCDKKEKLILDCKTTVEDSGENIRIKFYSNDTAIRTVTLDKDPLTSDEDIKKMSDSLEQNYCNNQIKEDYSCEVLPARKEIVLTEKGKSNVLMGETKKISIDKYKKNLKNKGFNCKSIEK